MIEAHLHLGKDGVYDGRDTTEDMILEKMDACGLDGCVVYPANSNVSLEAERERNERVRRFFQSHPGRIYGVCQVNPNYDPDLYEEELTRYQELGFAGVSVNPQIHGWDPDSHHGETVFEVANRRKLPLFIAVGVGLPLGQPLRLYELCRQYQELPVILVHAGKSYCGHQCDILAAECPNVFLETSYGPNMRSLKKYITKYGAERVIMGSGSLSQVEHSIYTYENCGITEEQKEWAMGKSVCKALGIEGRGIA